MALLLIKLPVQVIATQKEEGATLVEGATRADPLVLMGAYIVRTPHVFMFDMSKLDHLVSYFSETKKS